MANKLIEIEGIGATFAAKLEKTAGLKTTDQLLEAGATRTGRRQLAETTGIDEDKLLRWINMADLFRINGVGEEFSDLLEKAGVDTVKELRNRSAANLHEKLLEINGDKKIANRTPGLKEVEKWIEEAKGMEPKITY